MRCSIAMSIFFLATLVPIGHAGLAPGLAFSGTCAAERVQLLVDETWTDADGRRHVRQEIFDTVFSMIDEAGEFILLDFFLMNDFLYEQGPGMRPLSREITERLLAKRKSHPDVKIIFITDPINTVYGSVKSPHFSALEEAGVQVVWTDLNPLRDSNPLFSKPWRLLARPWGTGPGKAVANPMGEGRISLRSMLKLMNFKANHRKLIVTEKSLLVTSANPHDGSSAHWNTALKIDGAGMDLAWQAEAAILRMSGVEVDMPALGGPTALSITDLEGAVPPQAKLRLLTERKIKEYALKQLSDARPGARIDLTMFYFADTDLIQAFAAAKERGCAVRIILDPNKDAFGRTKDGVPNRQTAAQLVKAGIPVRWAATHGEQCHVKMLYIGQPDGSASLLLGSGNFTRRNLENLNAECDAALEAAAEHAAMSRARQTFDRWWGNADGRTFTADYPVYEDSSLLRKWRARVMEKTGLSTF